MNTVKLKHSPAQAKAQTNPQAVRSRGLTQNALKLIAAALMLVDHIGFMLLPTVQVLRIIGRLSFPLFAYFVYEGSRYTHNKTRYLLRMLTLGIVCGVVYYIYEGVIYGNVLITFTLSIMTLCAVQRLKTSLHAGTYRAVAVNAALAAMCVALDYVLCLAIEIDYGFFGVMLPVFAEVFTPYTSKRGVPLPRKLPPSFIGFTAGLVCLCVQWGGIQWFSLCAVALLLLYSGERGRTDKLSQYFFYLFYPTHLALLGVVAELL